MTMLSMMALKFQTILNREEGQDLVEYALLVGLLALAAVAALQSLSGDISTMFSSIDSTLAAN